MLIQPPDAKPQKQTKQHLNSQLIVHWALMVVLWLLFILNLRIIIAIQSGSMMPLISTTGLKSSAIYTLNLFMSIYTVGMTLFFVTYRILNRNKQPVYFFFERCNGLMLAAFIILITIAVVTM